MSDFTIRFGEAVELTGGRVEFANENPTGHTRIVGGLIDLNGYPIFNEDYRERLNGLIIDRYVNREIGMETVPMFRLSLRRHMNEHMPYFNRMYEADLLNIDPLSTVDMRTVADATADQTGKALSKSATESETGSSTRSVFSELPQTMLAGNEDYATNATDANGKTVVSGAGTDESENETTSKQRSDNRVTGYQGHAAALLADYRDTLTNVDTLLLDNMEPLFMGIWLNGDTTTNNNYHYPYGGMFNVR